MINVKIKDVLLQLQEWKNYF